MKQSYLLNHYDVEEIDLGYQFTTSTGIIYYLTFFSYPVVSDFLETKIYMFNIERSHVSTNGQNDVKVRNTVLYVLDLFFQQHEDALITICDVVDGKQFARKRLFDWWFREFNHGRLKKIESNCFVDNIPTFTTIYYSYNHYNQKKLEEEFRKLVALNFYC